VLWVCEQSVRCTRSLRTQFRVFHQRGSQEPYVDHVTPSIADLHSVRRRHTALKNRWKKAPAYWPTHPAGQWPHPAPATPESKAVGAPRRLLKQDRGETAGYERYPEKNRRTCGPVVAGVGLPNRAGGGFVKHAKRGVNNEEFRQLRHTHLLRRERESRVLRNRSFIPSPSLPVCRPHARQDRTNVSESDPPDLSTIQSKGPGTLVAGCLRKPRPPYRFVGIQPGRRISGVG